MSDEHAEAVRPALVALNERQGELAEEFVEGFGERDRILIWSVETISITMGEVAHDFYRRLYSEGSTRRLLLGELTEPDAVGAGERARERMVAEYLQPAFRSAYKSVRWRALEYVGPETDDPPDPSRQKALAMRPGYQELVERQRRAVREFVGGVEDEEALREWVHRLDLAAHGEVPDGIRTRMQREDVTRKLATGGADGLSAEAMEEARRRFVAEFLLEPFNRAARQLRPHAKEEDDEATESSEPTHI